MKSLRSGTCASTLLPIMRWPADPRTQGVARLQAEKLNESWNTLARGFGHIGGRLDADHRDTHGQEMLKQISVVACNLKHLALRTKTKPGFDHFTVAASMLDPKRRIR